MKSNLAEIASAVRKARRLVKTLTDADGIKVIPCSDGSEIRYGCGRTWVGGSPRFIVRAVKRLGRMETVRGYAL